MKRFLKWHFALIFALIVVCSVKSFAQTNCTFTTCAPFGNNDNRQIFGAIVTSTNISISGNKSNFINGVTAKITTTTTTDVLAAPGPSLYIYITDILVTNSNSTNGTWVNIIEETSGIILWSGFATSNGGGFSSPFRTPIKTPNSNRKVQVFCETAETTTRICISGYKGF